MDLFPFTPRDEQVRMAKDWRLCLREGNCMVAHAPTGIGKTAAALAPALEHALENNRCIFFITPRHSQHRIAVDTLRTIRDKFKIEFNCLDLIGKRWMCPVPGVKDLTSREFKDFCDSVRKTETCPHYNKTVKDGVLSKKAQDVLDNITGSGPLHFEECVKLCKDFCAYDIMMAAAKKSQVIICDYFHLFNPTVRKSFLARTDKSLEDSILIIDEGHNLASRLRELSSWKLSQFSVKGAIKEANHFAPALFEDLQGIDDALTELAVPHEDVIEERQLVDEVEDRCEGGFIDLSDRLVSAGEEIRIAQKKSFIGAVGEFLKAWVDRKGEDRFIRIRSSARGATLVHKKCLDPALVSEEVITSCHSCLMMSGTLLPLQMHADLLGFPEGSLLKQYASPFPKENRLNVIVPTVTTRFSRRGEDEFGKFGRIISHFLQAVPGNSAIFFPSYELLESMKPMIRTDKTGLVERQGMTKSEKSDVLNRLTLLSGTGAVLYGVIGGSFSEGVDYPGNLLKAVVVVGVPLERPTLEVNSLIEYYQKKFSRGWDYAYLYPAVNKALQAAGRCIRSGHDRGVVVFMDQRYLYENYRSCFPHGMPVVVSPDPHLLAKQFYSSTRDI